MQCRGTFQWHRHQQGAAIFQWQRDRIIPFEASGTPHSVEQQSREPSLEHVSHVDLSATSGKIALMPTEESRVGPKPLENEQEDCQSIEDDYTFCFDNNLTNDYFEYEQGQKDIIVKDRLRTYKFLEAYT